MEQSASPAPEADATAPRRSGRVVKAPTKFEPEPNTAAAKRKRGDNDEDDADNDVAESDEDMSDDEEAESDQDHPAPRSRKSAPSSRAKKPSIKKAKVNGHKPTRSDHPAILPSRPKKAVRIDTGERGTGLYVDIFGSGDAPDSVARQWLERYQADNAAGTAELVNCILQCAGCDQEITTDDIHDDESIPTRLLDLQNVYQEQQIIDYPLISKAKSTRSFRDLLTNFFRSLVDLLHETDVLYTDPTLVDNLHAWLSSMSSSSLRPFRHTATAIALTVQSGLVMVAVTLDERITNIEQQLQSAKRAKNKSKAAEIQRSLEEANEHRKTCSEAIQSFFDTVFVHRYRDVDPKIRSECVEALGSWIWFLPTVFMEPGYLRYLGWMLSDTSATTRLEVLKQLSRVFKRDASQLGHFIERFRARLIEIATQDSEISVRVAAISVIETLRESALLDADDVDSIGKLIFDNELRIRKAVVGFFIACIDDVYADELEKIGGTEALDELDDVEDDNDTSPRKEWLNIKCLAGTLATYDAQIEQSQQDSAAMALDFAADLLEATVPDTRISLAAQVLYERVPAVKKWETLAAYLLFDHTTSTKSKSKSRSKGNSPEAAFKAAIAPTPAEESILLDVLSSAVKASLGQTGEPDRHRKKGHRNEAAEAQEEIALELASTIPKLLNKFGAEPETAATVLQMEHFLNLDIFQQLRQDSSKFETLLDEISTQFNRHDDKRVLSEAAAALLHARQFNELEEMVDNRISVLWENTLNSLRNFDKSYELSARGNLEAAPLRELTTVLMKISRLAGIADCVDTLEAEGSAADSQAPAIQILSDIVHRGKYDPQEDEIDDLEDEVVSFAIKACQFYFMWKTRSLLQLLGGTGIRDDELDRLSVLRQSYRRHLIETLSSRAAIDQLRLFATGSLCDLHLTFAVLRPTISKLSSASDETQKYKTLVQEIEPGLIPELISIFDGTEKQYAKRANKDRTLNEPADNEDPVADDEDELEDDDDENLSKEERQVLELKTEKALCDLTAKFILAIQARILDQRGTQAGKLRRRILRNQTKLGHNFKELVAYLDEDKLHAASSRKPSRAAAAPSKPQKATLSAEMVEHDDDDEEEAADDEDNASEDAPPVEGSREDLRRRELLDEDEVADDEDEDQERPGHDVDDDVIGD
ncbi:hypothetical protein S7711_08320 [Stachybotrys chartarum IBT 7711]|uniref:SCD domain-containing protein n=1 Tax=Stachybotrys chartarum (strain CBS 109288 / IBT 7711) TaxID=1280523 RepID=A0A084AJK2_STACB|nr:hypothetical protein S7711_08320 [Stachybotrys chartarum IBT 7711]KFA46348.1 hypothetical protein S40293_08650 [Stachybotrys chartarum IBT 40293]